MNCFKSKLLAALLVLSAAPMLHAACIYEKAIQAEELAIGVMLSWATEAEEENSMFVIEKSMDGMDFSEVGTVDGAGTSSESKQYSFLDVMAGDEKVYYRLKQVDYDGSFVYSDVLSMQKQTPNQFMVVRMSSIAARDHFDVTLNSNKHGKLAYQLLNTQGTVVETGQTQILMGLNYLNIDMSDKATGIYKLRIAMGKENEELTFKKVDEEMLNPNFASKQRKN